MQEDRCRRGYVTSERRYTEMKQLRFDIAHVLKRIEDELNAMDANMFIAGFDTFFIAKHNILQSVASLFVG